MTFKMNNNKPKTCNSGGKPPRVGITMPPTKVNTARAIHLHMRLGKGRKFKTNIISSSILEDSDGEASEKEPQIVSPPFCASFDDFCSYLFFTIGATIIICSIIIIINILIIISINTIINFMNTIIIKCFDEIAMK